MNVGDILIDFPLLEEQYNFLVSVYQAHQDWNTWEEMTMDDYEQDMWEGLCNLLETILDFRQPLDKSPQI